MSWFRDLLHYPELLAELARALDCRAGLEVLQLEHLAELDGAFLERHALRPLDGFVFRLRFEQPVAGDDFFGLGERPVDDGALLPRVLDARAFGGWLQSR